MRAFVDLELAQAEDTSPAGQAQNPTTRGQAGLRSHIVQDGDSLHSIAYAVLRRRDALARDRRGQRHRRPAAPAPRHRADASRGSTSERLRSAETRRALLDPGRRRRDRRRPRRRIREVGSTATCACPTCARSPPSSRRATDRRGPADRRAPVRHRQATSRSRLGARDALTTTTLFKGEIVSLELDFGAGERRAARAAASTARTRCIRSRTARRSRTMTSSDIVEKIVREAGFDAPTATPAATRTTSCSRTTRPTGTSSGGSPSGSASSSCRGRHRALPQAGRRRPGRARVADDASLVQPARDRDPAGRRRSRSPPTTRRPSRRSTITRIDPQPDRADRRRPRERRAGVRRRQRPHRDRAGQEPGRGQAVAQALLDKLANGYIAAEGVSDGNPAHQGRRGHVQVSGIGTEVQRHLPRRRAPRTCCAAAARTRPGSPTPPRTRCWRPSAATHGSGLPAFGAQLVLGVVTNNATRTAWAASGSNTHRSARTPRARGRGATASAGNARGMLMLPVVGEEVLIGFEHDDTTRPYVLGSLFNGVDMPGDDLLQSKDGSFALLSDHKILVASQEDMTFTSKAAFTVDVPRATSTHAPETAPLDQSPEADHARHRDHTRGRDDADAQVRRPPDPALQRAASRSAVR